MTIVYFWGISPTEGYHEFSLGELSLEDCFEALTGLVNDGWLLKKIDLVDGISQMSLPVEAFDGQSIIAPLERLKEEWKGVLA